MANEIFRFVNLRRPRNAASDNDGVVIAAGDDGAVTPLYRRLHSLKHTGAIRLRCLPYPRSRSSMGPPTGGSRRFLPLMRDAVDILWPIVFRSGIACLRSLFCTLETAAARAHFLLIPEGPGRGSHGHERALPRSLGLSGEGFKSAYRCSGAGTGRSRLRAVTRRGYGSEP
jgi:hypothetical protein